MAAPNAPRDDRYEISPSMDLSEKLGLARKIAFDIIHAAVNLRSRQWMTIRIEISGVEDDAETSGENMSTSGMSKSKLRGTPANSQG